MCVSIYGYVFVYIYMSVCIYEWVCMSVCALSLCVYMLLCVSIFTSEYVFLHVRACWGHVGRGWVFPMKGPLLFDFQSVPSACWEQAWSLGLGTRQGGGQVGKQVLKCMEDYRRGLQEGGRGHLGGCGEQDGQRSR